MIRLGRRSLLLVAFCLLTSAATAYAERAWVLWEFRAAPAYEFDSPDGSPTGNKKIVAFALPGGPYVRAAYQTRS